MLERLLEMSAQASVLILVVLIVRMALKKVPKGYSYFLWVLVIVRLLCPVFIESEVSMQPSFLVEMSEQSAVRDDMPIVDATPVADDTTTIDEVPVGDISPVVGEMPEGGTSTVVGEMSADNTPVVEDFPVLDGVPAIDATPVPGEDGIVNGLQEQSKLSWPEIKGWLQIAWIIGTVCVAGVFLWQYISVKRRVKTAVKESGNIWLCDQIESPFVMGVFITRIYLPFGMGAEEKEYVLRHEQTHIRHRDPLMHLLASVALCLHWWNPLVWVAVLLMNRDMEMFCDETALRDADLEERQAYSTALLRFAVKHSKLSVALGFGESNTEKRVRNILNWKKPGTIVCVIVVGVILVCTVCFLTVPKSGEKSGYGSVTETETDGDGPDGETEGKLSNGDDAAGNGGAGEGDASEDSEGTEILGDESEGPTITVGESHYVISASEFEKGAKWVRATGGYEDDAAYYAFVHDFDKDGKEEAFIAIGTEVNAIPTRDSEKLIFGDLWYASGTGKPKQLLTGVKVGASQQLVALEDDYILILYNKDNNWDTDMYHVHENQVSECFTSEMYSGVTLKYLKNDELMMAWTLTDEEFNERTDSFTGQNTKEYPYAVKGNFYELVTAEEMKEQDFVKACGSEDILNGIKADYKNPYFQFLRRENGTWHVNIGYESAFGYTFHCVTYEETGEGLVEVKAENGYYRMNPASKDRDFCELVRVASVEERAAEKKEQFWNKGRWYGRSEESIQKCFDFLQQKDVCENDKYWIADYYIMYIDDNMEEDYLVMLETHDWSPEYTARDYEDYGRFLIFINGEQVYRYNDLDYSFTCRYGFTLDFCTDFDNDGYKELFLEAVNGGNGGNDIMVLKYKDGGFEQMPLFTGDGTDKMPYIDLTIYAGKGADECEIYCANTSETIIVKADRPSDENKEGAAYGPGKVCGWVRDYPSPELVEYEGKNALLIRKILVGEEGSAYEIGMAHFVIMFDKNGNCRLADWWVEDPEGVHYTNE